MECFWIECFKPNTKVITEGQSEERRNTFQSSKIQSKNKQTDQSASQSRDWLWFSINVIG